MDVDALGGWLAKLEKHAELLCWSERTKLLQFELHLTGRAERLYELLSSSVLRKPRKHYMSGSILLRVKL